MSFEPLSDGSEEGNSSPDPLALSHPPNTTPRSRWTTPRRSLSRGLPSPGVRKREMSFDTGTLRQPSPAKSIVIDTGGNPTTSPWRIKVTVQAEPKSGEAEEYYMDDMVKIKEPSTPSRSSPRKTRTTKVPLKDPDWTPKTPNGRGRGGSRKSVTPRPSKAKRKPTPARRKSDQISTRGQPADDDVEGDHASPIAEEPPPKRRRGKLRNIEQDQSPDSVLHYDRNFQLEQQLQDQESAEDDVDDAPALPEPEPDSGSDAGDEPLVLHDTTSQSLRGQSFSAEASQSSSVSPRKMTQGGVMSPNPAPRPTRAGRSAWQGFSPLPQRMSATALSSAFDASKRRLYGRVAEAVPELPSAEEEGLQPSEGDKNMWENMIKAPDLTQATAADSISVSASGNSDDEEDFEMGDNEVIGDETMMKSMDMTIVSPGSLYSRLDIHSSLADTGNAGKEKPLEQQQAMKPEDMTQLSGPSIQKSPPQERAQSSVRHSSQQQSSPLTSSPHVHFSSPLHASPRVFSSSDRPSNINSSRQSQQSSGQKSVSLSNLGHKSQSQSPRSAMVGNAMEASLVARHLPTPESDERPSQEGNDDIDDFDDEVDEKLAVDVESEEVAPEADVTRDASQVTQPPTFSKFSSSPSRPPFDEIKRQREEQWQLEREEISRQAVAAGRKVVTIESDDEDENEEVNRQAVAAGRKAVAIESDDEEEDEDEDMSDNEGDMWQEAANHSSNSLEDSRVAQRPSAALYKEAQRKNTVTQLTGTTSTTQTRSSSFGKRPRFNARVSSSEQSITGPPRDEIAALFKAVSESSTQPRTGLEQEDERAALQEDPSSPISNEDTSLYLRRKVSNMLDDVDFSLDSQNPVQTPARREPPPVVLLKSPGASTTLLSAAVDRRLSALAYSPKRSSPLKRPLNVDESSSDSSANESSLASHAQQLQHEMQSMKRMKYLTPAESSPSKNVLRPVAKRPSKSLLKVSQERRARALFGPSYDPSVSLDNSVNNESVSSVSGSFTDAKSQLSSPGVSSLASHIWSFVPKFNVTVDDPMPKVEEVWPPVHPSHPLLRNLHMLPRMHPWTNDHYTALRCLFLHWTDHVHQFDPRLPHNTALLTAEWTGYTDMQFANWGYDCQITESLIVLAAVFAQLLLLRDQAEYEELYGEKMVHGFASEQTKWWGAITEWNVVLRLFTVLVGHRVREDEAIGIPIDRTPALKWKLKGGWIWKRGWLAGLL